MSRLPGPGSWLSSGTPRGAARVLCAEERTLRAYFPVVLTTPWGPFRDSDPVPHSFYTSWSRRVHGTKQILNSVERKGRGWKN